MFKKIDGADAHLQNNEDNVEGGETRRTDDERKYVGEQLVSDPRTGTMMTPDAFQELQRKRRDGETD